jgi:hypothetical protein
MKFETLERAGTGWNKKEASHLFSVSGQGVQGWRSRSLRRRAEKEMDDIISLFEAPVGECSRGEVRGAERARTEEKIRKDGECNGRKLYIDSGGPHARSGAAKL